MKAGFQTHGLSFWEHGELVAARFRDLMGAQGMTWRLPSWFSDNQEWIKQSLNPEFDRICTYMIWHDCGKPASRIVDADGRAHYPDHAATSADIWQSLGGDPFIGDLIRHDMDCHLLRPSEAAAFSANPNALILLTSALCELHANASMFGGLQSDSFKIKFKRLEKCGATIIKHLQGAQLS